MARGTRLGDIVDMLRAELGESLSRANGLNNIDAQRILIRNAQKWLYEAYDWEFLKIRADEALLPGERLYTLPAGLTTESVTSAYARYGGQWCKTIYGIPPSAYDIYDEGVRSDPVVRWQIWEKDTDYNTFEYEVWPTPATPGTLRFYGKRQLRRLTDDNDRADLDDTLLVYAVALRSASQLEHADVNLLQEMFTTHLTKLRAHLVANKSGVISLRSQMETSRRLRPGLDYIPEP